MYLSSLNIKRIKTFIKAMYLHIDAIKIKLHLNIIYVFVCGLLFFLFGSRFSFTD